MFKSKFVKNGLNNLFAGGMVVNRQGLVLDVGAQNSGEYLDCHLQVKCSLAITTITRISATWH